MFFLSFSKSKPVLYHAIVVSKKSTSGGSGLWNRVKDRAFDFLYDFTEEGQSQEKEGDEAPPLQARK